ncbi:sulfate adenylyltransferase [archaeon CG10_big_fil_rev_8_21_14_0_10_43_11]|nr:MAG: sulfate adenylyltransferase [archaeon CG10_big_fil_rev_8_21_14_0_10_43_11]
MDLKELENKSIYIIREAKKQFKNPAMMWSVGKDSTANVWLAKKAFFGKVPFPVIHIDTSYKFKEMYAFRDRLVDEWNLDLIVAQNKKALADGMSNVRKFECCNALKTQALKDCMAEYGFDALILAIRRDEHGIRGKERVFSPRNKEFKWDYQNQPAEMWDLFVKSTDEGTHTRVHPILDWTELNVWEYVLQEGIPTNPLYFAQNGKRYRSLGCQPCTFPVDSTASSIQEIVDELKTSNLSERSGRAQDKEDTYTMQKLRSLGYM